jgi:hypothetical protein
VWHLSIPDLWPQNIKWRVRNHSLRDRIEYKRQQRHAFRKQPSPGEGPSPDEETPSQGEETPSQGETKKNQQEQPKVKHLGIIWEQTCNELSYQMTKGTFDTWIKPAQLTAFTPSNSNGSQAQAIITTANPYVRDWLEARLNIPIARTLAGIANETEINISYVVSGQSDPMEEP